MKRIVIFGATSAIAQAFARLYAQQNAAFFLIARKADRLKSIQKDLIIRGAHSVDVAVTDLNDLNNHNLLIKKAKKELGFIDIALIAHGTLSHQRNCETDVNLMLDEIKTNFLSPASILTILADVMEPQDQGTIAVIGSVAGDRGRKSNYVYGSAKGGLCVFAQGLRHRLSLKNINVTLIKPGFVDTPMTASLTKGGFLWTTPEHVANDIDKAIKKRTPIVYTPWFWYWIMLIIRLIPDRIFRRTQL